MSQKEIGIAEVRKYLEGNELSEESKRTIENAISEAEEKREGQPKFYLYRGILIIVYIGYCLILGDGEKVSNLQKACERIDELISAQEEKPPAKPGM